MLLSSLHWKSKKINCKKKLLKKHFKSDENEIKLMKIVQKLNITKPDQSDYFDVKILTPAPFLVKKILHDCKVKKNFVQLCSNDKTEKDQKSIFWQFLSK